jgi:hypothetical protein
MALVVDNMPSKYRVLNLIHDTVRKKKKLIHKGRLLLAFLASTAQIHNFPGQLHFRTKNSKDKQVFRTGRVGPKVGVVWLHH